jgi:hypothetical protein
MCAQELQGALLVTLRNSNQIIDDGEVRRKFQQFGDVKSVRPAGERHELVKSLFKAKSENSLRPSPVNVTLSSTTPG